MIDATLPEERFQRRFGGTQRLFGSDAASIYGGEVWVVGVGGVGSWVAEALARMGVARLRLFDMDHVAESNLNRQIHATEESIGMSKVQAMRERIHRFHPDCDVTAIDEFVTPENWPALAQGAQERAVVVVDACDQLRSKVAMAAWARATRCPLITVGAAGGKRRAQDVEVSDLGHVTHDPLLAKLRYELRRHHGAPRDGKLGVVCVFSRETVQASQQESSDEQTDHSLNCHGYGSAATVTGTFGLVAASIAIEQLIATERRSRQLSQKN